MTANPQRILLGRIVGAHGIRGEVVIQAYTAVPEDITAYGPLSDAAGARTFTIAAARATNKGVVARIAGVADRNAAEALKGTELYVARDRLPPPEADAYYHADLIGLTVVDRSGKVLGEIVAVPNYGAGDLLEIRRPGRPVTDLIPFTDTYVPEIDLTLRRAVVVLATEQADEEE